MSETLLQARGICITLADHIKHGTMKHNDGSIHGRCLECGTPINGRKDKKFCSLSCKNSYNNRIYHSRKQARDAVLEQLYRNYNILEGLLSDRQAGAALEELAEIGFDSRCLTGFGRGHHSHECCSCFDISYYRTGSRIFGIRRIEPADNPQETKK